MDLSFFTSKRSLWIGVALLFLAFWGAGAHQEASSGIDLNLPLYAPSVWSPFQWLLGSLGGLVVAMGLIWRFGCHESRKQLWEHLKEQESDDSGTPRIFLVSWIFLLAALLVVLYSSFYFTTQLGKSWVLPKQRFTDVVIFWEWIEALCLFLTAGILLYGLRLRFVFSSVPRRAAPILLAVVLFFAAGEGINWGQIGFDFSPPEWIQDINRERGIHPEEMTLFGFQLESWGEALFKLLILSYTVVLPLAAFLFKDLALLFESIKLPLPPLAFVPFGLIAATLETFFLYLRLGAVSTDQLINLNALSGTLFASVLLGTVLYRLLCWMERSPSSSESDLLQARGANWL